MFLELLRNVAILFALCMVYTLLLQSHNQHTSAGRFIMGLLFGGAAVFAMLTPTALFPGVLIDSRSIFISMAGLMGGWVSAVVAGLIALICRMILGGIGAPVGYAIIVTAALLGTGYHYMRRHTNTSITKSKLYLFGLIVHVDMMLLMFALPADIRWVVIEKTTLPVLLIYPIGTVLIGRLLMVQDERIAAEQALTESEQRVTAILRAAPVGIGLVSNRVFMNINQYICELTGYSKDELVGRSARMLYAAEEEFIRVGEEMSRQVADKGVSTVETCWHCKNGAVIDVLLSSTPINGNDLSAGSTFTVLDITERKRVHNALRNSEEKYRNLVESSSDWIWEIDSHGRYSYVSPQVEMILGYRPEELVGSFPFDFMAPKEAERVQKEFQTIAKNKQAIVSLVNVNLHKDGHEVVLETSGLPVLDEEGEVVGYRGVDRDVTQRKQAEKESGRLMQAIEQTAEMVMITDADANIQYVNPAFEKVSGYRREEVLGRNPRILQSGQQTLTFYQKMWNTLTSGKPWSGKLINKKKDGTLYTEEAVISPVFDEDGRVINYVAAKHDVTHELELEGQLRQAQKMEAVGQMAGGIAHDFNNLLQVISGYVELSEMTMSSDDKLTPVMQEIGEAAARGKVLISQLLAFSRRQVIQPQDLNLNDVIGPLLDMMRGIIGEHIDLDFIAGRELGTVHADRGMIEQVMVNLCVNARDAMSDSGKLTIETENVLIDGEHARAHAWATPGRYVLLSVTDTGRGMSPQTRDRVFEPFFTTKEVGKGTGLGLSTVFGIIKQHEGHINVYSELGQGTVFKIYLPTVERNVRTVSRKISGPVVGGNETILVAEDDKTVLTLAEHFLSNAGYTVLTATDGEEAVRVFEQHAEKIDMVLLDVVMPRMGGKKALQEMKKMRPEILHLFASGYSENAGHTLFIQNRGLHLLNKPYQAETLLRKIRKVLDEK